MGAKIQAFDIFQTPLSSHYPLPLMQSWIQLFTLKRIRIQLPKRNRIRIRNPGYWSKSKGCSMY